MRHARLSPGASRGRRILIGAAVVSVVGASGLAVATSIRDDAPGTQPTSAASSAASAPSIPAPAPTTTTPAAPPDVTFTILAAGDVLPHLPVMASARKGDGYDFSPLLAGFDRWVDGADLALCHMEVPVAPKGRPASGYPLFGTTPQLVKDLAEQGWDGCSTASNHSVDRGYAGVERTLDVFDEEGLGHVGTARSAEEAQAPALYRVTVDGQPTLVAQLSATYGTNGMPVDADKPWSVSLIDTDAIVEQAKAARADGADIVLVSIHDGTEYRTAPTEHQEKVAAALAKSGEVDVIIGHHAHVPQPMTKLDGGPGGRGTWVAYGLGNLLSNQSAECCAPESSNGLALVAEVTRVAGGPAEVTDMRWVATTVDRVGKHSLHALADIEGKATGKLSAKEIDRRYDRVRDAVGTDLEELTTPPAKQDSTVKVIARPR
ncbi:poly-gamma-glutamate synthesis protein (capsule biosynthesis protein) [Flavimobilis soli]|uniref:Poly-gamma-glutamate synthesis protein (Capsule biosynthesis protein) n=1 Tax=Flavimobilis soli TaxID=442709 RepID=A0A2A9EB93_9MICO|nr:poly-gamma-glutamate synthesis protein (capsule biosynthesis protein) [Flavimobilis soli]